MMNRSCKAIGAAILTAAMCAFLMGCSNNANNEMSEINLNKSNIESRIESNFTGNSKDPFSSTPNEISKPEAVTFAPTDEIKNAKLNSGLVQYNNDIFQRGGYITTADFVEKYKDSYDISYSCPNHINAGSYDECKDYLLIYCDDYFEMRYLLEPQLYDSMQQRWKKKSYGSTYKCCQYYLTLTPKNKSYGHSVIAYVANATSPDEKITLDKSIVVEIESEYSDSKFITPEWYPLGFNSGEFEDKYVSENKSYTEKSLCEALEANGLTKNSEFDPTKSWAPSLYEAKSYNAYWKDISGKIGCYIVGEQNLFDAIPVYYYSFTIDPNTDKLSHAHCYLAFFG